MASTFEPAFRSEIKHHLFHMKSTVDNYFFFILNYYEIQLSRHRDCVLGHFMQLSSLLLFAYTLCKHLRCFNDLSILVLSSSIECKLFSSFWWQHNQTKKGRWKKEGKSGNQRQPGLGRTHGLRLEARCQEESVASSEAAGRRSSRSTCVLGLSSCRELRELQRIQLSDLNSLFHVAQNKPSLWIWNSGAQDPDLGRSRAPKLSDSLISVDFQPPSSPDT